ncbi:MAG: hypothetical protein QME66_03115 [Candidatus Eisenbacteria bacterium]|nr:hypothetical protein [Candidatus Eisenbacteria bacterium]
MKKVTAVLSVLFLCGFIAHFSGGAKPALPERSSPAFSVALSAAVKTLEGVTSAATTGVQVAEAKGKAALAPTTDPLTCDPGDPRCQEFTTDMCYFTYEQASTCDGLSPTCNAAVTCTQYYTCDGRATCDASPTCNGSWTCWNSTCSEPGLTCDGNPTCDKGAGCYFTQDGSYTCNGTPECKANTLNGWPTCEQIGNPACGPTPSDRTSWGSVKARFK